MEKNRKIWHLPDDRREVEKIPRTKTSKFLRKERKVIEERLQQIIKGQAQGDLRQRIGPQHSGGFQPQTRRSEQWTVDPFW